MAQRVLLLGASGTLGRATAQALVARGHAVVALVRPPADRLQALAALGVTLRWGDVRDPQAVAREGLRGESFDALVSCLASRTGVPRDAWAIDHDAHQHALRAAVAGSVPRFVQLSALCVQKPQLAFQQAKLAFERSLQASPLAWTIVRPTAFFKSLSGQLARVQAGRPFLVFGDGRRTACKPIADEDLGDYLAGCLDHPERVGAVLPIGGPGPAITPLDQAQILSGLLGRPVPVRHVPVALMDAIVAALSLAGRLSTRLAERAEFARIGRYYATESMLVWDEATGRYDAEATPETGHRTLAGHYAQVLQGQVQVDLGDHAVF